MFIYGLYSTKDLVIRYVGKTKNTLNARLKQHLYGALKKNVDTYKDRWIRKCYKDGYKIEITQIEKVNVDNINEREIFWIQQFPSLTNTTIGGEGGKLLKYDKSYEYCKKWLREHMSEICSSNQYTKFAQKNQLPSFMPIFPCEHFKSTDEWVSWGDFLSTGRIQDNKKALKYIPYEEAKKHLKQLGLLTIPQYKQYLTDNNVDFLPKRPERFYQKKGWVNWGIYLGFKKSYPITEELLIRYLNTYFKNVNTEYKYGKNSYRFNAALPKNIVTLKKLFPKLNWLKVNKHMIENYKEAEKLVRSLNISNSKEYRKIVIEKYSGILPLIPSFTYKDKGWRNMMTYLGNNNIKHRCDITLELFRRYMKIYHPQINSSKKYKEFYKNNKYKISARVPSRPDITFKMTYCQLFSVKPKRTVPICDLNHFLKVMCEKHNEIKHVWQYNKLIKENKLEEELPRTPCYQYKMKWNEILEKIKKYKTTINGN